MIGTGWKEQRYPANKNQLDNYESFLRRLIFEAEKNPRETKLNFDTIHHYNVNVYDTYTGTFSFIGEHSHNEYRTMALNISKSDILANFPTLKARISSAPVKVPPSSQSASVTSTTVAVWQCEQWLKQEFALPEGKALTKDQFWDIARTKFQGKLAKRGFLRAWAYAVREFPERSKAGRKSKQRFDTPV